MFNYLEVIYNCGCLIKKKRKILCEIEGGVKGPTTKHLSLTDHHVCVCADTRLFEFFSFDSNFPPVGMTKMSFLKDFHKKDEPMPVLPNEIQNLGEYHEPVFLMHHDHKYQYDDHLFGRISLQH